jgi:hypothetical protein
MEAGRLGQWLSTVEGAGKALLAVIGIPAAVFAAVNESLKGMLPDVLLPWTPRVVAGVLVVWLFVVAWRSFRRYDIASRLEQPDLFTLKPKDAASLIGRAKDLQELLSTIRRNRLVLLDGESGCGKSALVGVGVVSEFEGGAEFLPLLVRDWGERWIDGPLAATLEVLWLRLSVPDRERLDWRASPDLSAPPEALANLLSHQLKAVHEVLHKRPLLIADQFDDHQAQHRARFLDPEGNWLTPTALAEGNVFWRIVRDAIEAGRLHLLVVTRSDTAAGLASVRFLPEDRLATRSLPRIDNEYLRPLLLNVAPDDAKPQVVSNPAEGWHELRERLERDLKAEGAILMQQVRTVLLGLRQLGLLTPRRYLAVGGLRGVETLMVSHALRQAARAEGGGETALRRARAVLARLVLPGNANRAPKAQRATLSDLSAAAGDRQRAEAILGTLQDAEVARPAESADRGHAWQLDHDYLARAVIGEARQADRWASALRDGHARFSAATGWRERWLVLLAPLVLARIGWERGRRRLSFGESGRYVGLSVLKQAVIAACLVAAVLLAVGWNQSRLLTERARELVDRIGSSGSSQAVLEVWLADERLRTRLHELVQGRPLLLERVTASGWPLAHAGFEAATTRESARMLRDRILKESDNALAAAMVRVYVNVASRLSDPAVVQSEVEAWRAPLFSEELIERQDLLKGIYQEVTGRLEEPRAVSAEMVLVRERFLSKPKALGLTTFGDLYKALVVRVRDPEVLKKEATVLRSALSDEEDAETRAQRMSAYATVVTQLKDDAIITSSEAVLRTWIQKGDPKILKGAFGVYEDVIALLRDPVAVRSAADALRDQWQTEKGGARAGMLVSAYGAAALRLDRTEADALRSAATALREVLAEERWMQLSERLGRTYVAVLGRLADRSFTVSEAGELLGALSRPRDIDLDGRTTSRCIDVYVALAERTPELRGAKSALSSIRGRLFEAERPGNGATPSARAQIIRRRMINLTKSYVRVSTLLKDPAEIKAELVALREVQAQDLAVGFAETWGSLYAATARRLQDPLEVKTQAGELRESLLQETRPDWAGGLAVAYGAVVRQLKDVDALKAEMLAWQHALVQLKERNVVDQFASPYAAVAGNVRDPQLLRAAAVALRAQWTESRSEARSARFFEAYTEVARRLQGVDPRGSEVTVLRGLMLEEKTAAGLGELAEAYASVSSQLDDVEALKLAGTTLRDRLMGERDDFTAGRLAAAYAVVAVPWFQRAADADRRSIVRDILLLCGHPNVVDPGQLLVALDQVSGEKFNGNMVKAVAWAGKEHGLRPRELRPAQ